MTDIGTATVRIVPRLDLSLLLADVQAAVESLPREPSNAGSSVLTLRGGKLRAAPSLAADGVYLSIGDVREGFIHLTTEETAQLSATITAILEQRS